VLEENVLRHLFECFGNPQAVQRAIEDATPNLEKIQELRKRRARVAGELEKIDKARNRILGLIEKDTLTDAQAAAKLNEMKEREARQQNQLRSIDGQLGNVPSPDAIRAVAERVAANRSYTDARFVARKRLANRNYSDMTWEEKRSLVATVFAGRSPDDAPLGVYIRWLPGDMRPRRWTYSIRGQVTEEGLVPLNEQRLKAYYDADKDFYGEESLVTSKRSHWPSRVPRERRFRAGTAPPAV
jgi:hypothetical protein